MSHERSDRRPRRGAVALALAAMAVVIPASADITGDGLAEMGVFGFETSGQSRGAWFQAYDGTGTRVANLFLRDGLEQVRIAIRHDSGGATGYLRRSSPAGRSLAR